MCKNFIPNSALESAYLVFLSPSTVDNIYSTSDLEGSRTTRLDTPEESGTPPAHWHKNGVEPYQGQRLTPPAWTTLQGRDPHHTLPGCQRGNHGLHTRGHGCPRADHIIATSPPILAQHISRAHRGGRQISTCNDTISRAPHPPFVKDPVGRGGHRFQKGHISAPPQYHHTSSSQWNPRRS